MYETLLVAVAEIATVVFLLVLDFPKELSDMFDPTKGKPETHSCTY